MIISNFNAKSQYVQEDFWDVQKVQEFWKNYDNIPIYLLHSWFK